MNKLKIELPCDPAGPIPGIYPEPYDRETAISANNCTVHNGSETVCLDDHQHIMGKEKTAHVHSRISCSPKKWTLEICRKMDGPESHCAK